MGVDEVYALSPTYVFQAVLDGVFDAQAVPPRKLGRDVDVLARKTALADSLPCLFLIPVRLCGVYLPLQCHFKH